MSALAADATITAARAYCDGTEAALVDALRQSGRCLSAPELAAIAHTNVRRARAILSHLRSDHGLPVCSTPAEGFFWPRSRGATAHTAKSLQSRIDELQRVLAGFNAGVEVEFGQQELFPGELVLPVAARASA
jgi:hypothetical protein